VRYEPNNDIDFTWEKEWRIKCDKLFLEPDNTTIFVKDRKYLNILLEEYYMQQCY
jgi:hypothetical protein